MVYEIQNDYLQVTVSTKGAELQSIRSRDGREYMWQGDPAYWAMRSPNPFPYVSGLKDQRYRVREQEYEMLPFGLVKDREFTAAEISRDSIVLSFASDPETRTYYPWDFLLGYIYRLEGNKLLYTIHVKNKSADMMYFGFCGHTAFNVPLEEGLCFEDYYLDFGSSCHPMQVGMNGRFRDYYMTPYHLEGERRIPLTHEMFADHGIFLAYTPKTISLKTDKGVHGVRVHFPDLRYIGFFHTYGTDAPFICIEPWSTMVGCFDGREDLACQPDAVQLSGGAFYENTWEIEIY